MQSPQSKTPRIENQFNQPLSISVIFPPLSSPSASFFSSSLALDSGWERRAEEEEEEGKVSIGLV